MGQDEDTFARRLQLALEQSGMTQAALARSADLDQSSISRYLRGQCEPNLRQFRSIAIALNLRPSALLPDADQLPAETFSAIASAQEDAYHLFRGGAYLGDWHGKSLDAFPGCEVLSGKEARRLLDTAGIRQRGARSNRALPGRSAARRHEGRS